MSGKPTKISVTNYSGVADRNYMFYFLEQGVTSPARIPSFSVIFFATQTSLSQGGNDDFEIHPGIFAVICECRGRSSLEMGHETVVTRRYDKPVKLGDRNGNGTTFMVISRNGYFEFDKRPSFDDAPFGTFRITCPADLPEPNNYAVGIGRQIGNTVEPVTLVRCAPGQIFDFTPKNQIRVMIKPGPYPDYKAGMVVSRETLESSNASLPAVINGTGNPIQFSEDGAGRFSVDAPVNERAQHASGGGTNNNSNRNNGSQSAGGSSASGAAGGGGIPAMGRLNVQNFPEYGEDAENEFVESGFSVERLKEWDVVFIVDDTGTMQLPTTGHWTHVPPNFNGLTRWRLVCHALEFLADVAASRNLDGANLRFLLNKGLNKEDIKTGRSFLDQLEKNDVKKNRGGTYFEPALGPIINRYISRLSKHYNNLDPVEPRPLNILVLTDGAAMDKERTKKMLQNTAATLDSLRAPQTQLGIQFVQVGEDRDAKIWLDGLGKAVKGQGDRDIVDTMTFTEMDHKEGTFGTKLARILIGAMDPDQRL